MASVALAADIRVMTSPLSSDPHSWLRPLFARLRSNHKFAELAPSHQFNALVVAAEEESPSKAGQLREWNSTTQIALLNWLNDVVIEQSNRTCEVEQWRVRKGDRELTCVSVYLPVGIDMRLLEGRRLQAHAAGPRRAGGRGVSTDWRTKLLEQGWTG